MSKFSVQQIKPGESFELPEGHSIFDSVLCESGLVLALIDAPCCACGCDPSEGEACSDCPAEEPKAEAPAEAPAEPAATPAA